MPLGVLACHNAYDACGELWASGTRRFLAAQLSEKPFMDPGSTDEP